MIRNNDGNLKTKRYMKESTESNNQGHYEYLHEVHLHGYIITVLNESNYFLL